MGTDLDFLGHVRSESARFREVLAGTDPAARVPSCPDWDAGDLLWHLTGVQHFWAQLVRGRLTDPSAADEPERAESYAAQLEQFDEVSAGLADALAVTPDDVEVWTWFPTDHTAGFIRRRQSHEALIHRVDAELTAGLSSEIDLALAHDGVQEVLDWMYQAVPPWAEQVVDGPVGRIATSDSGGSWLVQVGRWGGHSPDSGRDYTDRPSLSYVTDGEVTFTVSGPARDLDRWLWNRPTVSPIEIAGDAAAFEGVIRTGVQ